MALSSALCSAVASVLIQRGLRGSNFFAGFWINIAVGMIGLWSAVLVLVPFSEYNWRAVPYFVFSGVVGTTGGRFFRVVSIQKVGASVASAIGNLAPFISSGLAIVVLGEHVTLPILAGTMVIVVGTILLSLSGKHAGFEARHLVYPFLAASCFGVVAIARKLGLGYAGPLFGSAMNITAAMIASSSFVMASGNHGALRCDRRSLLYFIGGGIAENSGVFLVLLALGFGDVSVVIPLAGTAPLFVLLLAYLFPTAAEKLSWRVVVGSALIVLGVVLLSR
jgi:uncharacterized membrane protein